MLGKRKREVAVATRHSRDEEDERPARVPSDAAHEIFRRYFEGAFEPLPESARATPSLQEDQNNDEYEGEDDDGDDDDDGSWADEIREEQQESEWEGLSDTGQEFPVVEVVEHRSALDEREEEAELQRLHYKSFMSSKPPKEVDHTARKKVGKEADGKKEGDDDESEAINLKHDLDLQRLLKESHLLEQAKASSSTPGSHRHKALDMRVQSLGSKVSMFQQEKMPLAHRRGILAKATTREANRRREAQENGIILERPSGKARAKEPRRERGVDAPAVGRFRGGTLKLSKKDVLDIQGGERSRVGGKRGRR